MKLIFLLIVCLAVFYIGYLFSSYYKKKLQIFHDLEQMCDILENQIRFKKEVAAKIIADNRYLFSNEFNSLIDTYFFKTSFNELNLYLSEKELNLIKTFFDSIGMSDVEGELNNIKAHSQQFKMYNSELKTKNEKVGGLGIKLGSLCALLIFIIFI